MADALAVSRVIATGDARLAEPELLRMEAQAPTDLANICASLMGYLSTRYLEASGDRKLASLSDKQVGEVFIQSLVKAEVKLDRNTRRSIKRHSGHIVRSYRNLDDAWPGGTDFGWTMYLALSAAAALRASGSDPETVARDWLTVVHPEGAW